MGVQAFLPAVRDGDKRIILVDGEYAGAVNRVPAADDLRSNMVRGGSPKKTELTPREREICERLGPHLRERGLLFVGIDVIGDYLTEINVTSPTGIRGDPQCRRAGHRGADLGQDRGQARVGPAGDGASQASWWRSASWRRSSSSSPTSASHGTICARAGPRSGSISPTAPSASAGLSCSCRTRRARTRCRACSRPSWDGRVSACWGMIRFAPRLKGQAPPQFLEHVGWPDALCLIVLLAGVATALGGY